jgi:hypothetical protein
LLAVLEFTLAGQFLPNVGKLVLSTATNTRLAQSDELTGSIRGIVRAVFVASNQAVIFDEVKSQSRESADGWFQAETGFSRIGSDG